MVEELSALVVVQFMPQEWFDRMATIKTYEQDQSAKGRLDSWLWAFNLASRRFFGGGFEAFSRRLDAHSIYFEVLGEHGFVGLLLFLLLWAFAWMAASRIRRQAEKIEDMAWLAMLMRMTQVALAAYLATGAFLGMAYFDYPYNLVLIVVVAQRILAAHQAGMAPAPAVPVTALAPSRRGLPSGASP